MRDGGGARAARALVGVLGILAVACGGGEPDAGTPPARLADLAQVAAEDVTTFADIPGVEVSGLDAERQAWVVARANRVRCDCGCVGHSINACLHQSEPCQVAARIASVLVEDARTWQGALPPAEAGAEPAGATAAEGSEPEDPEVPSGESGPAEEPAAEGDAPAPGTASAPAEIPSPEPPPSAASSPLAPAPEPSGAGPAAPSAASAPAPQAAPPERTP